MHAKVLRFVLLAVFIVPFLSAAPQAVTFSMAPDGTLTISESDPPYWRFVGSVGFAVQTLPPRESIDQYGYFVEYPYAYTDQVQRTAVVRVYATRGVVTLTGINAAVALNNHPLFSFSEFPPAHHFSYQSPWSHAYGKLGWLPTDSPWLFFDDSYNTVVLSSASHFPSAQLAGSDEGGNWYITLGIDSANAQLPENYSQSYILTFGRGIQETLSQWGSALQAFRGIVRPGNHSSTNLRLPHLETDAGSAFYYSCTIPGCEQALQASRAEFFRSGITLGMTQLDSWWYPKGGTSSLDLATSGALWSDRADGLWQLIADPSFFLPNNPSNPASGFHQNLGRLIIHSRWVGSDSPYRLTDNAVSGNVITSLPLWRSLMSYLSQSAPEVVFRQDWLSDKAAAANSFDEEIFLSSQAQAAQEFGIGLEYCMPKTYHYLMALEFPHLATIRNSNDRFAPQFWSEFLFNSGLAKALQLWPFADNTRTTENTGVYLSVMSAGPVGFGDFPGTVIPVPEAFGFDGSIFKPDQPMAVEDSVYLQEAINYEQQYGVQPFVDQSGATITFPTPLHDGCPAIANLSQRASEVKLLPPIIASTYSDFGKGVKAQYVFAFNREPALQTSQVSFFPRQFGFGAAAFVYNYDTKTGYRQDSCEQKQITVSNTGSRFVIAPIFSFRNQRLALVGEESKFTTLSRQRFSRVVPERYGLGITVQFAPGETQPTILVGYALNKPRVIFFLGNSSLLSFDSRTNMFRIQVTPTEGQAQLLLE